MRKTPGEQAEKERVCFVVATRAHNTAGLLRASSGHASDAARRC